MCECVRAGEARPIPRVETFASNLHDSWGAHAMHDSPPTVEGGPLQDPPRLSTESLRSATSQASKASSGGNPAFLSFPVSLLFYLFFVQLGLKTPAVVCVYLVENGESHMQHFPLCCEEFYPVAFQHQMATDPFFACV